jgi:glycosyltransferase involved in cell wall biosynthesis
MRILHVTERVPQTDGAEVTGGVEARSFYVARHLAETHDVVVLADRTTGSKWAPASLASIPRRVAFIARTLVRGLRTDFDIVEGSNLVVFPLVWILGRIKRRPVVYWYPDVLIGAWMRNGLGPAGWIGEMAERLVLCLRADHYIAISEATARKLVGRGIDEDRIDVIPCGYDPALVAKLRRSADVAPPPVVAVVSRLVGYKRVSLVIDAVARLRDQVPDIELQVVGQGPELDDLIERTRRLGMRQRCTFFGFVRRHEDVLRLIAKSRVLVSASEIEGFGIVVVEALSLGVPAVVSDIEAHREVTAGGTGGALFAAGELDDLVEAMRPLLTDDDEWRACADKAVLHAARYTWPDVAAQTGRLYERLISL